MKIRYKLPKSDTSQLITTPIDRASEVRSFDDAPRDARFAAGVAGFAELLRGGRYSGSLELRRRAADRVGGARRRPFGYAPSSSSWSGPPRPRMR